MDDATGAKLAIRTPIGLIQPRVVPFGSTGAVAWCARNIEFLLQDKQDWARNYLDDTALGDMTFKEFVPHLDNFLTMCEERNIRLNGKKSIIGPRYLPLLGRLVGQGVVRVDPEYLETIRLLEPPTSKVGLRQVLGMFEWMSGHVPHLATLSGELWDLLKLEVPWKWTASCQECFDRCKKAICDAPCVLHIPVHGAPKELEADASSTGLAAALFQIVDNKRQLIGLWSRRLRPSEQNKPIIELEAMACLSGVVRFRDMILGSELTIYTDHSNLCWMDKLQNVHIQQCHVVLLQFSPRIRYIFQGVRID